MSRTSRARLAASLGALASLALASACYGPHTITYVDSTRPAGGREHNHDLDHNRVEYQRCGAAGVARVETYSSWFDMVVSYFTFSAASRSVDITCAKEP